MVTKSIRDLLSSQLSEATRNTAIKLELDKLEETFANLVPSEGELEVLRRFADDLHLASKNALEKVSTDIPEGAVGSAFVSLSAQLGVGVAEVLDGMLRRYE